MRLHVDLETLQLIEGPGFRNPVTSIRAKRGDGASFEVQFLDRGLTPVQIGDSGTLALKFGAKPNGNYASDYLVLDAAWTMPEGEETTYTCAPNLNTEELNEALGVGGPNELASLTLMAEIEWSTGGLPTSTRTFSLIVENDVNRGTEGTPLPITNTPEEWLADHVVDAIADAMLQRGMSSLAPERPSGMAKMVTTKVSGSFTAYFRSSTGRAGFLWFDGATAVAGSGNAPTEYSATKTCPTSGNWADSAPKSIYIWPSDSSGIQSGNLTTLRVESMNLRLVDVSGLASLTSLDVSGNGELQHLDIRSNSGLTSLDITNAPIPAPDLGGNGSLTTLACGHPSLTAIDLSAVPLLTSLTITGATNLPSLDLSAVPLLASMAITNAGLTLLDLSGAPLITTLTISNCDGIAAALDITDLTALTSLTLSGLDGMTALDASNNTELTSMAITSCEDLTALDLTNSQLITTLDLGGCLELATLTGVFGSGKMAGLTSLNLQGTKIAGVLDLTGKTSMTTINVSYTDVTELPSAQLLAMPLNTVKAEYTPIAALSLTGKLLSEVRVGGSDIASLELGYCNLSGAYVSAAYCPNLTSVRAQLVAGVSYIDLQHGNLSAAALNQFYTDLTSGTGMINVVGNPGDGTADHNPDIATLKGYSVTYTPYGA